MTPERLQTILSECSVPEQNQVQNSLLPASQAIQTNLFPALSPIQMAVLLQQMMLQRQTPALQSILPALVPMTTLFVNPAPNASKNDSDSPTFTLAMQHLYRLPCLNHPALYSHCKDLQRSIKSVTNTSVRAPRWSPILPPKGRKDYCKVCKKDLVRHGRSQGTRRHVLQSHLQRAQFFCTLCDYVSNYDKALVHYHAKRHPNVDRKSVAIELPRWVYGKEMKLWMETCFGEDSDGSVSQELQNLMKIDKSVVIKRAILEALGNGGVERVTKYDPAGFDIFSLLTTAPSPDNGEDVRKKISNR